jgi:hypothetical protein
MERPSLFPLALLPAKQENAGQLRFQGFEFSFATGYNHSFVNS